MPLSAAFGLNSHCQGQRWLCDEPTGIGSLRWERYLVPVPQAGEVLLQIEAASVNFPDLLVLQGRYQWQPTPPFVPGIEFAGTVVATGPGADSFAIGDAVMSVGTTGGFASHACVAEAALKRVPSGMSLEHAAVLLVAYGTAAHALFDRAALKPGERILVLGAAGGTGSAAVQVAKSIGATVIAGVSSSFKADFCRQAGADVTINYRTQELRAALARVAPQGVDVVYDTVGGGLTDSAFRSLAWRGRYLVVGFAGGDIPRLPMNLPLLKGGAAIGVFWGSFDAREPAASRALVLRLGEGYAAGWLRPAIHAVMPMTDLKQALEIVASRSVIGKIVLRNVH